MTEVQPELTTPTDMQPFAERLKRLVQLHPSTFIKESLDFCQKCAPLGFDHLKKLYEFQESNLGTLDLATKREGQLVQETFIRQRQIMASGIADAWSASGEILFAGPIDKVALGARYIKETSTKLIENYEEIGKQFRDTQATVSQLLCNRVDEFVQEIKSLCAEGKLVH